MSEQEQEAQPEQSESVEEPQKEAKKEVETQPKENLIFAVRTTANREEQVVDFLSGNVEKKGSEVYAIIKPHGMRSYIFIETVSLSEAEQAVYDVPYARGVLPQPVPYEEIEHMVETVKKEVNIQKGDIAEIISGPFKREKAKITKFDKEKEEVVVELLEAAVPIPITLKMDALKIIRRDDDDDE
jgi:transcription termination/antitermination protein NusG